VKAIVQDTYGSPDVLELRAIAKPVAGHDEVLARVRAAGVDQGVWLRAPKNPVPGYDVAGRVEAVGENVTRFQAGEEVFGTCRGSFAEYACARADRLARPSRRTSASNGAHRVIDYMQEDFADGRTRYDVILDIAGNRSLSHLRRALATQGTLVIVGGTSRRPTPPGSQESDVLARVRSLRHSDTSVIVISSMRATKAASASSSVTSSP
jgi:NADPH:quinone reductase-like Zn-dependent oxidoreductase